MRRRRPRTASRSSRAVNSHGAGRRVAPPGGREGRISTNPICMGVPTDTDPWSSTSARRRSRGEGPRPLPEERADGRRAGCSTPTASRRRTRPSCTRIRGARSCRSAGRKAYKGSASGCCSTCSPAASPAGRAATPPRRSRHRQHAFVRRPRSGQVRRPRLLLAGDDRADGVRAELPDPRRVSERITLPGDPEREMKKRRLVEGIAIPDGTWAMIQKEGGTPEGGPLIPRFALYLVSDF